MRKKKNALGYTYLAPALISILLVTCLPIIYTVILSFTNYNMYHLTDYTFVGLENYLTVFSGSIKNVFFPVLGWTICFALLSTAGSYAMGLILAILLNNPHMKESKIYRAVLIVPWALPSTIAILAWQGLLNEQYGGINNLLHTIGIAWNVPWLTNPFWARVGLIIVNVWQAEFKEAEDKKIEEELKNEEGKDYLKYIWLDLDNINEQPILPQVVKEILKEGKYPEHKINIDSKK